MRARINSPSAHRHARPTREQSTVTQDLRNFVNGEYVDTADGIRSDLIDPATGKVFATAPVSTAEDVDAAFQA
ncbi:hypothetical protein ACJOT3_06125, partial [Nocardiopsis sp. frass1]